MNQLDETYLGSTDLVAGAHQDFWDCYEKVEIVVFRLFSKIKANNHK